MFHLLKNSFSKLKRAFSKTRSMFTDTLRQLLGKNLSDETLEEIERLLFESDLGSKLASTFLEEIKSLPQANADEILSHLEKKAKSILENPPKVHPSLPISDDPLVIFLVGVNGSGKTTSTAKLARLYQQEGKKVLLAAGDTFRAAASEQLEIWAGKIGLDLVMGLPKGDPSAVLHDALSKAKAKGYEVVIADTAGRLESKTELMHELAKMRRVCQKLILNGPHETFLVLDATVGQNAIDQAKVFNEFTPLTGIILTKIDGSAKGGIVLSIYKEMGIPVRFLGIGEEIDDFIPFEKDPYIEALFAKT